MILRTVNKQKNDFEGNDTFFEIMVEGFLPVAGFRAGVPRPTAVGGTTLYL